MSPILLECITAIGRFYAKQIYSDCSYEAIWRSNWGLQPLYRCQDLRGIIQIHSCVLFEDAVWLIYYYQDGITLEQFLNTDEQKDPILCKVIACQIQTFMKSLHERGYAHGDFHEANILVNIETRSVGFIDCDCLCFWPESTYEMCYRNDVDCLRDIIKELSN